MEKGIRLEDIVSGVQKNTYLLHLTGKNHIFGERCSSYKKINPIYREECWPWIEVIDGRSKGRKVGTITFRDPYPKLNLLMEGEMIERLAQKQTPIKTFYYHRLICMGVHPNPNNLPSVDHINGHTVDYRAENLRWTSVSDNNRCKRPRADYDKLYDILDGKNII